MLYLDYSRKAGRVDPQPVTAAARTSRRSTSCAQLQRGGLRAATPTCRRSPRSPPPGRWSRGRPTSAGWASASSGTWAGCTTRCDYFAPGPGPPQVPPRRAHLPHALRLHRELRPAALARRGGARQGLAARQDAGRRLAEVRQPAAAVRLHVRAAGQEAALHGRRVRPVARVEPRRAASTGTCCSTRRTQGVQRWVARPEPRSTATSRRCTSSTATPRGFEWVDCNDADAQRRSSFLRSAASRRRRGPRASCNFTPVPRDDYRVGVPAGGFWREVLNSDAHEYGGSGMGNGGGGDGRGRARGTAGRSRCRSPCRRSAAVFLKHG